MTRLVEEVGYPSSVDIRTEFSQILGDIEAEMSSVLNERQGHARPLYEMLAYHLGVDGSGVPRGKRIRPLLGALAYKSLTGDYKAALPGAAALELGHNFSLVHDDIEDSDAERHHRPTLWALWGIPLAINAGDALFALSRLALYRLMDGFSDHRVLELMKVYDETCLALCEGQYLDIAFERRADVTVDAYLEMIGKKTAALIGGSVRAGAILATDDDTIADAYQEFGYALGMAFQMADDVKGTFWTATESGKAEAGDVRKRKKTLPVVWAMQHASSEPDRLRLAAIYLDGVRATDGRGPATAIDQPVTDEEVAEVLEILERCGAREHTLAESRRYRDRSLELLERLPCPPEGKRELALLVRSMIAA
jgi:geranylgeranyl diphosphate synthase, type I